MSRQIDNETKCYMNLSNAIMLQTIKDYRNALYKNNLKRIKECERFFKSGYALLINDRCAEIMKAMPIKVEAFRYLVKRLKRRGREGVNVERCPICDGWVDIYFTRRKTKNAEEPFNYYWDIKCKSCEMRVHEPANKRYASKYYHGETYVGIRYRRKRKEKLKCQSSEKKS